MHTAVVELDTLTDTVRATAQHHDLFLIRRLRFAFVLIGRIHVSRVRGEFGGASIHALVNRTHTQRMTTLAHCLFGRLGQIGQTAIREPLALQEAQLISADAIEGALLNSQLQINDFLDLHQEPRVNLGQLENTFNRHTDAKGIGHVPQAIRRRVGKLFVNGLGINGFQVEAIHTDFQTAQRFLQRLLESTANRHHLAYRLHLRRQAVVGHREFFKGKTRHFGDHVVDRWLERGRSLATGNFVSQFIERITHRQLGCHLGNRETGGLRG